VSAACAPGAAPAAPASARECAAEARRLRAAARRASRPDGRRSALQLVGNLAALAGLEVAIARLAPAHPVLALALALPAGGFLVRLFITLHDCGHGACFRTPWIETAVGRALGFLTLTPFSWWKLSHDAHHAGSGDLSRRGLGDIDTLTVAEYRARPAWRRLAYRAYRHPLVLFGLGPAWEFFVRHRLPLHLPPPRRRAACSILALDAVLGLALVLALPRLGAATLLWAHGLPLLVMATAGVWLFYVQHQFDGTWFAPPERWSAPQAALRGASFYDLPAVLRFFTGNVGIHHVHHLFPGIPSYRLYEFLGGHPELRSVGRVGLRQSLSAARLALWDEARGRLVPFSVARDRAPGLRR
jgi:omega-6 fatty acid desaturase (delta-12 desaturase)